MKIEKMKENKNGSVTMTYELDSEEENIIKKALKKKKKSFTNKNINAFILEGISNYIKKEEPRWVSKKLLT